MSQQIINVGATANDGTGDTLRLSQQKANQNFTELYGSKLDSVVAGTNITIDDTDPLNPIISSSGGGGGSQTLADTLILGNTTDGENISISSGDSIILDNGSLLRKGTIDAGYGGANGIAQICAVGYELKWEAGRLYVMGDGGTTIREVSHNFTTTPVATDDITKGFIVGSRWLLDDGTLYICTDNTDDTAVWELQTAVTSVGLTMPSAFSVTNSPITSSGDIAVTGAGVASQYVRGDGTLANFPTSSGGGASVSYYLNGSVSQGTLGGNAYKEMDGTPVIGAGTDFTINADGYIAQFITDSGNPNKLLIPSGNWNFETYFSASSGGGSPKFYIELYKYNGTTFTLISSNSATPENITGGTAIDLYFTALAVPPTVLLATDRLAVRFYVLHSGRTITMHTENSHLSQIITTFSTGLNALNGLTEQSQYFATGTSGTDFAISSATDTHTFNLPTASATNRGALSSSDWSTFNDKQDAFTGYANETHVSALSGNDITGNGSLLNPYATITKALSIVGVGQGLIIVHPGTYTESPTSNAVVTIVSINDNASKTFLVGTLTLAQATRVRGIRISNLVITTSGSCYIDDCSVTTSFTKSGNGFVEMNSTTLQCSSGSLISGSGNTIINGDYLYPLVVNNAAANVIIKISNSCVTPSVLAGTLAIVDSILVSASPTGNAITSSAGSIVTLANSQILTPTLDGVARVNLQGFYSIFNVVYDRPNSTLVGPSGTGGSTNSIVYSQYINADKFITQGGTSSQFLKADGSVDSTAYQALLSSGVNIKTINGNSVLGSGNLLTGAPLTRQEFSFSGAQTFTLSSTPSDIYAVFVNGQELNSSQYSFSGTTLTIADTLETNDKINILYTPASVGVLEYYTKAQINAITIATTSPLTGGGDLSANRTLSISQSNGSTNGYLSSTDWTDFDAKQDAITLTTNNYSGLATLVGTTLNIPNYEGFIPKLRGHETFRGVNYSNNSTTEVTSGGITIATTGSTIARSVSSTNYASKQVRKGFYGSVVSTGRYTGTRGSALLWYLGGGFKYVCDVYISDTAYSSGCRQFYGMAGQTTDLAYSDSVLVSSLTNIIGIGSDALDTNLQVFYNDATGTATKIDLGANFPANRTAGSALTTVYSIELYNDSASTDVKYCVKNKETGSIAMGTLNSNLPLDTQGLNFFASRCMGAGVTNTGQFDLLTLGTYSL